MSYTTVDTDTYSYTTSDVEAVMRRFTADLVMIAQSSGAISEATARSYAHDLELLAKNGYLKKVDLTLLSGPIEARAAQYMVNTSAGDLVMSRPGNALWPRLANASLRIVVTHTDIYTETARQAIKAKLKIGWVLSGADTSHPTLKSSGGRTYASNGWGLQRKDFAA
jgi:hypothetical protein